MYPSGAAQVSGSSKLPVSACANKSSCHGWNVKVPQPQELGGLGMEIHGANWPSSPLPHSAASVSICFHCSSGWGWQLGAGGWFCLEAIQSFCVAWLCGTIFPGDMHPFSVTESSREETLPLWNISSESFICDFRGGRIDPKYVSPPRILNLASKCWLGKGWELTQNVSTAASKQDGSRATTARANLIVLSPQCTPSACVLQHS